MPAPTRLYIVTDKEGGAERLIEATHPSHAVKYVADQMLTVRVASAHDAARLVGQGVSVEKTKHEQMPLGGDS